MTTHDLNVVLKVEILRMRQIYSVMLYSSSGVKSDESITK
jgi:hypothetical protein